MGTASPHTRGWTPTRRGVLEVAFGFPAHAGMDPGSVQGVRVAAWLPRTRGDGPVSMVEGGWNTAASPHTRGWTRLAAHARGELYGFPAHAGMDPSPHPGGGRVDGLPRTRGDGPRHHSRASCSMPASPHTRGWTLTADAAEQLAAGFPAHAGMDPAPCGPRGRRAGLPRTRGDGPGAVSLGAHGRRASPHTRGWTPLEPVRPRPVEGFPAHAGMDPGSRVRAMTGSRLPRTRGDGPVAGRAAGKPGRASPHTRGWTLGGRQSAERRVGFPAHAGMDPGPARRPRARPRLPRTRGDGPGAHWSARRPSAASPHTRGWTLGPVRDRGRHDGFPAHAGMDPPFPRRHGRSSRLPRTRGDGPTSSPTAIVGERASPHTRGWTRARCARCARDTGFPAHAGMDPMAVAHP